jgi:hypothetical protein
MNAMQRSGRQGIISVVQQEITLLACEAVTNLSRKRKSGAET